jgi:hypothetical protein
MNDHSDNDFDHPIDDSDEFVFTPDNFEVIMERMRGLNNFFNSHTVDQLVEGLDQLVEGVKRFQQIDSDGQHVISVDIIEKFSDFLISETLNELVRKDMVDVEWSDEHNDFVFKAKGDK